MSDPLPATPATPLVSLLALERAVAATGVALAATGAATTFT